MSKLLPTQLPQASGDTVSADTFNRLIRILEINLGSVDPDAIQTFNSTEISELQGFDGTEFRNLYEHQTYLSGLSATMSLGTVTVSTP
jgi:hypothetical protein